MLIFDLYEIVSLSSHNERSLHCLRILNHLLDNHLIYFKNKIVYVK